jgi:hypothetical protein
MIGTLLCVSFPVCPACSCEWLLSWWERCSAFLSQSVLPIPASGSCHDGNAAPRFFHSLSCLFLRVAPVMMGTLLCVSFTVCRAYSYEWFLSWLERCSAFLSQSVLPKPTSGSCHDGNAALRFFHSLSCLSLRVAPVIMGTLLCVSYSPSVSSSIVVID